MKTIAAISVQLLPDKRARLAAVYSEGVRREHGFEVRLPEDDPRVQQLLEMLHDMGYARWPMKGDMDYLREYRLMNIREYEPSDFDQVEYMEFWPEAVDSISAGDRDDQGRLRLERPTLKNARRTGLDFARATLGRILVLQPVRDLLLDGSFRHLVFRDTVLVTGRGTHPGRYTPIPWEQFKVSPPWHELTSDLVLPPLSPSMDLRDDQGNSIRPGDYSKGCCPVEGLYNHAELHYRRSDLNKVDPFDVAMTFENFGVRGHTETRSTIVSKRFYDYCREKGLKGRWAPVRIEEDR